MPKLSSQSKLFHIGTLYIVLRRPRRVLKAQSLTLSNTTLALLMMITSHTFRPHRLYNRQSAICQFSFISLYVTHLAHVNETIYTGLPATSSGYTAINAINLQRTPCQYGLCRVVRMIILLCSSYTYISSKTTPKYAQLVE